MSQRGVNRMIESVYMLNTEIAMRIKKLQKKQKQEVLKFIEYLQTKENASFIAYINNRTMEAIEAKKTESILLC